jgi:hypothetical protein
MTMRRIIKSVFSFILVLLMLIGLSAAAFAAPSTVSFENGQLLVFAPGSVYTTTSLFDNFKGVMPGDVLSEEITVKNNSDDCDYIKVYVRAILHDEAGNPISDKVLQELQNDTRRGATSELEYMYDFLSQLSLTVKNGATPIYDASPDQLDGLTSNVYLGTLRKGETLVLNTQLSVPLTLGNEYANRIGEVDWVFVVEGYDDEIPEETDITVRKLWVDNGKDRPTSVTVRLLQDGNVYDEVVLSNENLWIHTWTDLEDGHKWSVVEVNVPKGYYVRYYSSLGVWTVKNSSYSSSLVQTGLLNWPVPVMGGLGLALIAVGIIAVGKKRKKNNE